MVGTLSDEVVGTLSVEVVGVMMMSSRSGIGRRVAYGLVPDSAAGPDSQTVRDIDPHES